jgi:hypothetical protein
MFFSRFIYHMFYISHPLVTYLLTLPHTLFIRQCILHLKKPSEDASQSNCYFDHYVITRILV